MAKIETLNFGEDFIEKLIEHIERNYSYLGADLSRLAVVFGGKRPSLFVQRLLQQKFNNSFYPPKFFSIEEFIHYSVSKQSVCRTSHDLDQCYFLYQLTMTHAPWILKGRESFAQFLPWSREILSFIDHLDLEGVSDEKLRNIQAQARIGYPVPEDTNRLLESIVDLRGAYHQAMRKTQVFSRGYLYRFAAESVAASDFGEFDQIIFCNFFYWPQTQAALVKNLYDRNLATFLFQGSQERWPTLKRTASFLGESILKKTVADPAAFKLKLYSAFDGHSQVATVREILKNIPCSQKTVIVLPDAEHIIPLLSQIAPMAKEFNISMGYPLKRSSLFSLVDFIFQAQLSRGPRGYYSRDFLRVLRHPLIKNLDLGFGSAVTRVLAHKIEEVLTGLLPGALSGHLFIDLKEILDSPELYEQTQETLKGMEQNITPTQLKEILSLIFKLALQDWENIKNFREFALSLEGILTLLLEKSPLRAYPLNLKIAEKMFALKDTMATIGFCQENFSREDIFKIFSSQIEREIVAFNGSPLKGLQILGLFETRALSFENVIVLDANEGVLPRLNIYEPLIPREVMISLGLDRLEQEEEIQRYQFMRLIACAKEVHLVFEENAKKEKSRFVEELVWEQQKKRNQMDVVPVTYPSFSVKVLPRKTQIVKTAPMISFLKNFRYSASSLNTYLRSPVEFYYSYVLGLREKEDLLEEPENRQIGVFVHSLLEETFKNFIGKKPVINEEFKIYFRKVLDERFTALFGKGHQADAFLLKKVLDARLNRFLDKEAQGQRDVNQILYIEKKFEDQIALSCGSVNFVYRVDRVDELKDGTVMIIDYKTGSVDPMPKDIEKIESMDLSAGNIAQKVISFQIPLYFHYLAKTFKGQKINAAYYNLRTLEFDGFIDQKMPTDYERINAAFIRSLDFIMAEIFDISAPFKEAD